MTASSSPVDLAVLAARVIDSSQARSGRYLLGIAGPPAAGKSTLAERLRDEVNAKLSQSTAEIAPMDGFHMFNADLDRLGLRALKGAPQTFDVEGYVAKLKQLHTEAEVGWPAYDREVLHEPVPDAITIGPDIGIVITEGNYLLLDQEPWAQVRQILHAIWYLDEPLDVITDRLRRRHLAIGRTPEQAEVKIRETDLPNAVLIEAGKGNADLVLLS
ncbi:nucleoside/nucleotide kinase family protein [Saccharothrix texasensis]|uniref:Phosphoribulokinase/uridine kinase family protein n=1 Tax=Saccharothrix texasensis TaxID=103734 RepID=A0A3N1HH97_9PSEU|nr:nucleoside/nucleotide kinase family protein [Saccharothrix texasensis]ROP41887.1 phosphoribulokinase/uridine kinase family protein [Saccharothrix texasensis]